MIERRRALTIPQTIMHGQKRKISHIKRVGQQSNLIKKDCCPTPSRLTRIENRLMCSAFSIQSTTANMKRGWDESILPRPLCLVS